MKTIIIAVSLAFLWGGVARAEAWELVWSEEFNYEGLPDASKWDYEEGFIRNREMQYYTRARKENVRVESGVLVIEGRKDHVKNPQHNPDSTNWQEQRPTAHYTSGCITTLGKAEFQYGRLEVRAKMPRGNGMWPAIWMMGTNFTDVGWPRCGEIDIMEYVGKDPHRISANNHFANPEIQDASLRGKAIHKSGGGGSITINEPYKDFHVYAIEWDETSIVFFVDDTRYATFDTDMAGKGPDNPFRKPHYLLLNLAMGGSWGGDIDDGVLPQKYEIDYVRYYRAKTGQHEDPGDTEVTDRQAMALANDILGKMTLEEKVSLCHGSGTFTITNIPRVGIEREFNMIDNSSTVATDIERNSFRGTPEGNKQTATAFPSMSALGATWNRDLAYRLAGALGREGRFRGKDMQLGPGVNIHRTPLCGRNWEYFGEDPAHSAKLVVPYVKGIQAENVAATVKHYACNNSEWGRVGVDVDLDERALREIYLPAFEAAVKEGGALAMMSGFNRVNGEFCSHSDYLNNQILKKEWGFKGLVATDWGGVHDTVKGALGGTDLEMAAGRWIRFFKKPLLDAVKNGTVPESVIDDKARRVLYVMAKTKFIGDHDDREPGIYETPGHTAIALKVAEESVTLLKNEGDILPLNPNKMKTVLVLGDNATHKHCSGGGSARARPKYEISPLEGIRNVLGDGVEVMFRNIQGVEDQIKQIPETWIRTLDPTANRTGLGQPAFKVEYFNNTDLSGAPVHIAYDKNILFNKDKTALPHGVRNNNFSIRWSATISPYQSGEYELGAAIDDGVRIIVNDKLVAENWKAGGRRIEKGSIYLDKNKEYNLRVEYLEFAGAAVCEFGIIQDAVRDFSALAAEAVKADAVIYFTGNNHIYVTPVIESEGSDRKQMDLHKHDDQAIATILKTRPDMVIVNLSGSPVTMPWIDEANALVQTYFNGQEAGTAIANVLFGKVNPSGKLTFTIPKQLSDSPAHFLDDYNNKYMNYKEGVFVGYRWFDAKDIEPQFPFGHGLSYTTFKIGKPMLSSATIKKEGKVAVKVEVTNTGKVAGAEVVQLYVAAPKSDVERPVRELKNFGKVFLQPGETKPVYMWVTWRDLAYWDTAKNDWNVVPGKYGIEIGNSSRNIKQTAKLSYTN